MRCKKTCSAFTPRLAHNTTGRDGGEGTEAGGRRHTTAAAVAGKVVEDMSGSRHKEGE